MPWRPHPRNARTDPTSPRAWGTCDRCGFVWNFNRLIYQFEWRGFQPQNTFVLVCPPCLDELQRQLGALALPPDPLPIKMARVEPYPIDELWEIMMEPATGLGAMPLYLEASLNASNGNAVAMLLELTTIPMSTAT